MVGSLIDIRHLGKYLRRSYEKFKLTIKAEVGDSVADEVVERLTKRRLQDELRSGVQTIQYQINTLMTTNGQSPFVTIFLNLQADDEYLEENAIDSRRDFCGNGWKALKMIKAFL